MNYLINIASAISVLFNTLVGGSYRNTFSARSGYMYYWGDRTWARVSVKLLDMLLGDNHCYEAWQNEKCTFEGESVPVREDVSRDTTKEVIKNSVYQKVKGIYEREHGTSGSEELSPETLLEGLCMDSLDVAEFMMIAEENFNIDIPDEQMERCKTVQDVVDLIEDIIDAG